MKNILISVIVILLLAVGGFYFYKTEPTSENYACTLEAKICPDGSAVGRVGPDCQFEACPVDTNPDITISSRLNKKVSAQGFSITPLEIMEDSMRAIFESVGRNENIMDFSSKTVIVPLVKPTDTEPYVIVFTEGEGSAKKIKFALPVKFTFQEPGKNRV